MDEFRLYHVDDMTLQRMKLACERVLPYLVNTQGEQRFKGYVETIESEQQRRIVNGELIVNDQEKMREHRE
jgi:hypothetical protein